MTVNSGISTAAFQDGEIWTLSDLLPGIAADPARGLQATGWPGTGNLTVPLGTLRDPKAQTQSTFSVDLSHWAGNLGITGAAQSGKTTLLRTLICGLALTHTPAEVQVYGLSGEDGLRAVAGLPHVGAIADRRDPAQASEIAWLAADVADQRRELFAQAGIDSMEAVRAFTRSGQGSDDPFGDIFVIVDDWEKTVGRLDGIETPLLRIAESGLRYGVHLVVSAARRADLPEPLRKRLAARIELPAGDLWNANFEEALDDGILPLGKPGYGLVNGPGFLSAALPRIDGSRTIHDLAAGVAGLVSHVTQNWRGQPARPPQPSKFPIMRLGPETDGDTLSGLLGVPGGQPLALGESWRHADDREHLRVPIGVSVDGTRLELDLKEASQGGMGPHAVVTGETGAGKTTLLQTFVYSLALTHSPEAASFLVACWDGPGMFAALGDLPHSAGIAAGLGGDPGQGSRLAEAIAAETRRRQELLRQASVLSIHVHRQARQQRPELPPLSDLVIAVDDADKILTASPELSGVLAEVAREGRGLGMHLLLAGEKAGGEWRGALRGPSSCVLALRAGSEEDSRAAIGTADACELPPRPGTGYLRAGRNSPVRFAGVLQPRPVPVEAATDPVDLPSRIWPPDTPGTGADSVNQPGASTPGT